MRGKSHGRRMLRQIVQPQRLLLVGQQAENPPSRRQRTDPFLFRVREASCDELGQAGSLLVKHPDRTISSAGQLDGFLDH